MYEKIDSLRRSHLKPRFVQNELSVLSEVFRIPGWIAGVSEAMQGLRIGGSVEVSGWACRGERVVCRRVWRRLRVYCRRVWKSARVVALWLPTWYANCMLIVCELYKNKQWSNHHYNKLNNGYHTIRQQNRVCAVTKFKKNLRPQHHATINKSSKRNIT